MLDVGIPPPWWFDASDEIVETVWTVALEVDAARRRAIDTAG